MPISPMYFNPLSFQQASPFLTGFQAGTNIGSQNLANVGTSLQNQLLAARVPYAGQMSQAQLKQAQLQNALSQNTLNYAPQTSQANLNVMRGLPGLYSSESQKNLSDAQLATIQAQLYPYSVSGPLGQLLMAQRLASGQQPTNSAQPGVQSNNGGMTIQPTGTNVSPGQSPNVAAQFQATGIPYRLPTNAGTGNYQTLPGGLSASQGQQVLPQLNTGPSTTTGNNSSSGNLFDIVRGNILTQMGKNPAFGSTRAGAGGTFINPATGSVTSTDTSTNTTLDQRTVAAIQRVSPLINSLSNNLSPFQTASGQGKLRTAQLSNYLLGTNLPAPNQYAQGKSALEVAPEGLLRAWGLPATNESIERMQAAVEPRYGESSAGYKQRLVNTLQELQQNQSQAKGRLKSGMDVDVDPQTGAPPLTKTINGNSYMKINGMWYQQ